MNTKNIAKLEAELERLRKLVFFDELTGILNRRGFNEMAGKQFEVIAFRASNSERRTKIKIPFSVIFVDLDNLKPINDILGHEAGSEAIIKTAKIIKNGLRANDVYCRWGGDEYLVALLGIDAKRALIVAEKLRNSVAKETIKRKNNVFNLSASFGVASYNGENDLAELINHADQAMYQAKKDGKNQVTVFGK